MPILRAGLGLLEGFVKFLPDAEKGHIGLYRDEQTYEPVEYLFKLPKTKNKLVIVVDPMLATGNSAKEAINLIKLSGVKTSNIMLVSLLAAPEGIKNIQNRNANITIGLMALSSRSSFLLLNKNIVISSNIGCCGTDFICMRFNCPTFATALR